MRSTQLRKLTETAETKQGQKWNKLEMAVVIGWGRIMADDFEDSVAIQSSAFDSTTTFTWPKSFRTPVRQYLDTEKALGLTGFQENLPRYLMKILILVSGNLIPFSLRKTTTTYHCKVHQGGF